MSTTFFSHPLDVATYQEEEDRGEGPSTATAATTASASPRFSRLLGSVLGSPFLTTSDLPTQGDSESMLLSDTDSEMETIDGTFTLVPRAYTVTRPASPSPSFRTDTYSIVNWTESDGSHREYRTSFSDAAPTCSVRFRPLSRSSYTSSTFVSFPDTPPTPHNTIRFLSPHHIKHSRSLGLLPKLWDVLRESSPTKRGKRRVDSMVSSLWNEIDVDGMIDYANLPPLDGEEGELVDDEACFIDFRVVTGVDIISLLPDEVGLHIFSYLDLPEVIACLSVSKTWRRLAQDNALWQGLFRKHKDDGWTVDLRKFNIQTPASLLAMSHSSRWLQRLPAVLEPNWRDLYVARMELDRRWEGTSIIGSPEDKENSTVWKPAVQRISGHRDSVYCLEFDSSKIITGSRDRTIKVWSLKTGKCLATLYGHLGSVLCLKFDKDWDLDPANSLSEPQFTEGRSSRNYRLFRKGYMVSGSSDSSVCVWDLWARPAENEDGVVDLDVRGGMCAILKGHSSGVLDIRCDERWIVSCSKDTLIRVWNRATLELHCTLKGHEGPVNAVGLEGNRVASASGDGKLMLWDIITGQKIRTFDNHGRGLACIEFKDDIIVSGSEDFKIKVWNASTGECIRTLAGHDLLVRALSFDPKSNRLVSGSYDRTVKVWDLKTGRMLGEFKGCHSGHIYDVKLDACRIVSTSHDQNICVLDFSEGLNAASLFS